MSEQHRTARLTKKDELDALAGEETAGRGARRCQLDQRECRRAREPSAAAGMQNVGARQKLDRRLRQNRPADRHRSLPESKTNLGGLACRVPQSHTRGTATELAGEEAAERAAMSLINATSLPRSNRRLSR